MSQRRKLPSAIRCIKTAHVTCTAPTAACQKAPSAKRCIKTNFADKVSVIIDIESESTERQTVH